MASIEIICGMNLPFPSHLHPIVDNIYYDPSSLKFYRFSHFPPAVVFENERVASLPTATVTQVDPHFLLINHIYRHKQATVDNLPIHLKHLDLSKFTFHDKFDFNKVYDFLQIKVKQMMAYFREQDLILSFANYTKQDAPTQIHQYAVNFLKAELDQELVMAFAEQRYEVVEKEKRKMMGEQVISKKVIEKKKKSVSTKKPEMRPKSQPTLDSMFKKK